MAPMSPNTAPRALCQAPTMPIDIRPIRRAATTFLLCIGFISMPAVCAAIDAADVASSTATVAPVCQCITHIGTDGKEWGALFIAPPNSQSIVNGSRIVRLGNNAGQSNKSYSDNNTTDCLVIYIRAAPDEIVELRFYEIRLTDRCQDSIQVHAHLRSATISETARNDEIICQENAGDYIANRHPHAVDLLWDEHVTNANTVIQSATPNADTNEEQQRAEASRIRLNNRRAILSSGHLLGVHLKYNASAAVAVSAKADFRFHKKALFKIDGNLLPTTLCDYQFLPYPIASGSRRTLLNQQQQQQNHQPYMQPTDLLPLPSPAWRYFFSPRYPAKYSGHVKCAYKFIGRPNSHVEVVFQEIDLPPAVPQKKDAFSKSCISVSDRLTIYDSRTADTSAIVDVLCQAGGYRKKILSSGAHLLIEFESSSNRSANGFSAKYRFVDAAEARMATTVSSSSSSASHITLVQPRTHAVQVPPSAESMELGDVDDIHRQLLSPDNDNDTDTTSNEHADTTNAMLQQLQMPPGNNAESVNDVDEHFGLSGSSSMRGSIVTLSNQAQRIESDHIVNMHGQIALDFDFTKAATQPYDIDTDSSNGTPRRSKNDCLPVTNCDIVLSSNATKSGILMSPMFPRAYEPNTHCRFEFRGNIRERIQLSFKEFTLPSEADGDDCELSDTLQILMPNRGRFELVEVLCGLTLPKPIMSNGPRMLIEFRGRNSGRGNRGVKAEYKFLENFGIASGQQLLSHECSFVYNSSAERQGWFLSPNFPGNYPRNVECNYYFYGTATEKVNIRFTYFDVEGIYPCDEKSSSDTVEFSNFQTVDRKFALYCQKLEKFAVQSDGPFFRVTFRSNDRLDGTGFRAAYDFESTIPADQILATSSPPNAKNNGAADPKGQLKQLRNAAVKRRRTGIRTSWYGYESVIAFDVVVSMLLLVFYADLQVGRIQLWM